MSGWRHSVRDWKGRTDLQEHWDIQVCDWLWLVEKRDASRSVPRFLAWMVKGEAMWITNTVNAGGEVSLGGLEEFHVESGVWEAWGMFVLWFVTGVSIQVSHSEWEHQAQDADLLVTRLYSDLNCESGWHPRRQSDGGVSREHQHLTSESLCPALGYPDTLSAQLFITHHLNIQQEILLKVMALVCCRKWQRVYFLGLWACQCLLLRQNVSLL